MQSKSYLSANSRRSLKLNFVLSEVLSREMQSIDAIITNSHQLAAWSSCSSSSSFDSGTVLWLYRPCAINCKARGFFCPVDFLIFALLFWNQILICASLRPNSPLNCCRLFSVKYRFSLNSCCKERPKKRFALRATKDNSVCIHL